MGTTDDATLDGSLIIAAWCTAASGPEGGSSWLVLPAETRNHEQLAIHAS
jgi:hypothetical protein